MLKYKIYLVTNTVNGKKYIGQTKQTLHQRWYSHKWNAKHPSKKTNQHFYNAMRRYGVDNFELVLLEDWDTIEEANEAERWWVKILDTTNPEFGYNGLEGGHFQPSPEMGRKISEGKKKAFQEHPEVRTKISESRKGMKLSEEHKQAISEGLKANHHRVWLGKKRPEEEKQRISETLKMLYATGQRKKAGGSQKGHKFSPPPEERRRRTSETMKKLRAEHPEKWSALYTKNPIVALGQEPIAA